MRLSGGLPEKRKTRRHSTAAVDKPQHVASSVVVEAARSGDEVSLPSRAKEQKDEPVIIDLEPGHPVERDSSGVKPPRRTVRPAQRREPKTTTTKAPTTHEGPIPLAPASPEVLQHAQPLLILCNDQYAKTGPLSFQAWSDSLLKYFQIKKNC